MGISAKLWVCVTVMATFVSASPAGLINFSNSSATRIWLEPGGQYIEGEGQYDFGLFIADALETDRSQFTFAGAFASSIGPGRISGGGNIDVPGWDAGVTKSFFVAGWSHANGQTSETAQAVQAYLCGGPIAGLTGYVGWSDIGTRSAGGYDGNVVLATPVLFGSGEGQVEGFGLSPIPEPATLSLLALGGVAMLRRRR